MPLPYLRGSRVQVWRIALDDWSLLTPARLAWLNAGETARAERFHGQAHAQRWRVAHVVLREILAEHTDQRPEDVSFVVGPKGKPALPGMGSLAFNLSHAADFALIAVGGSAPLGVDIEHVTDAPDLADIALSHFALDEQASIAQLSELERVSAFYRCWTRKEAVVKALGSGIGYDLQSFSVSVNDGPAALLRAGVPMASPEHWTLADLKMEGRYVGALAVQQPGTSISVADWVSRSRC